MSETKLETLDKCIDRLKDRITNLDHFLPGSLTEQYNVCGKLGCKCKRKKSPEKHGPYLQLAYYQVKKHTTCFIPRGIEKQVKAEIRNYKIFKDLIEEWVALEQKRALLVIQTQKQEKKHT